MKYLTCHQAYGRDRQTAAEIVADWEAGKDMRILPQPGYSGGTYVSKRELPDNVTLNVRFKKDTEVVVLSNSPRFHGVTTQDDDDTS